MAMTQEVVEQSYPTLLTAPARDNVVDFRRAPTVEPTPPPAFGRPLRVLYTIPNFTTAGSGQVLYNLIEHLDPNQVQATVCVRKRGGHLEDRFAELGVTVLELPTTTSLTPRATFARRAWEVAAPLREHHFDLWHSYHYLDDYSEPLIARMAGARGWIYTKKNMSWNHRSWWMRSMLSTRIAAMNTDMMSSYFDGRVLRNRTALIPPGLDVEQWTPDPEGGADLRAELGISPETPVVACVAHLTSIKGQDVLARALAMLPDVHVLQVGRRLQPEFEAIVRSELEQNGAADRFHWVDYTPNVRAVLSAADVVCLPTVLDRAVGNGSAGGEGCPVAVLEAMASGVATVGSDVPGIRDLIEDDVTGGLAQPGDPASLAVAIDRMLKDPARRRRIAAAGQARAATYSNEAEASAYQRLYEEAMESSIRERLRPRSARSARDRHPTAHA